MLKTCYRGRSVVQDIVISHCYIVKNVSLEIEKLYISRSSWRESGETR